MNRLRRALVRLAAILALGAAFCFALALILTQFGLRTVPSWRSPLIASNANATPRSGAAMLIHRSTRRIGTDSGARRNRNRKTAGVMLALAVLAVGGGLTMLCVRTER